MEGVEVARGDDLWLARRLAWRRAVLPARVAFGGSVFDGALLDAPPGAARVRLFAPAAVPDTATLRLGDGESRPVRRRRQDGARVVFEFVDAAPPPAGA